MAIVSTTVKRVLIETGGVKQCKFEGIDQAGRDYFVHLHIDASADPIDFLTKIELHLNKQARQRETAEAVRAYFQGADVFNAVYEHTTPVQIAKQIIRPAAESADPNFMIMAAPAIEWALANFTIAQIKNALNLSDSEWVEVRDRYLNLTDPAVETVLTSDKEIRLLNIDA
ncbi:MAG: hypothetical protein OEW37_00125 [Rhodospirillaceae bacterium]|nr:hypothetical protein [Rhodospirillaceae bacterium]